MPFLTKDNVSRLEEVEKGVRNRWRWEWLVEKDANGENFDLWLQKMDMPGVAFCTVCLQSIKYGTSGKKKFREHADLAAHQKNMKVRKSCESIPVKGTSCTQSPVQPPVGVKALADRVAEQKAKLLGFVAEHHLPFSIIPDLVELCQTLAQDKKATMKMHMQRQCGTYTMTHGLAAAFKEELRQKLQGAFYSLNIDEATNNAMDKIVNIIIRYFDEEDQELRTFHLASRLVNQATADNIHEAVMDALEEDSLSDADLNLSPRRMISCLMDNCATMRGQKSGVETKLRCDNPHLLNISGDTVHIVANAAKEIFKPFGKYLEDIASDIYYDLEKSPKAKDLFGELQVLLGRPNPLHLVRPCPSRFLQMKQVTDRLAEVQEALRLYYFAFLSEEEQDQYMKDIEAILEKAEVSPEAAARITIIQQQQAQQAKSSTNVSRKDRLLTALFMNFQQYSTLVNIYRGILEKLEGYTKLLQSSKPIVHTLHAEMFALVRKVLKLFLRSDAVPDENVKELTELKDKVRERKLQVKDHELCVGKYSYVAFTKAVESKPPRHWAVDIAKKLRTGYENAASLLLSSLPLRNSTIIKLSCLDPHAVSDNMLRRSVMALATSLPNVVAEDELGVLDSEIREYSVDADVKTLASNFTSDSILDKDFWVKVFHLTSGSAVRYPVLSKLVKALLTIFCGPLVESSFNTMDDIIRVDRTKMTTENYEASAIVRSVIKIKWSSAARMLVNKNIVDMIKTSKSRFSKHLETKKKKKAEKMKERMSLAVEALAKKKSKKRVIRCRPRPNVNTPTSASVSPHVSAIGKVSAAPTACLSASLPSSAVCPDESVSRVSDTAAPCPRVPSSAVSSAISATAGAVTATPCANESVVSGGSNSKSVCSFPKGGKRAALKGASDIRDFFKKPRL